MTENVTLDDAKLAEIEARAKAVQFIDAPWRASGYTIYDPHGMTVCERVRDPEHATFIAATRVDVPTLIAALRASREALRLVMKDGHYVRCVYRQDDHDKLRVGSLATCNAIRAALGEEVTNA